MLLLNGNDQFDTFRSMEFILIYISVFWLFCTGVILLRNLFEFKALSSLANWNEEQAPLVSICIPARNEEKVIERCVTSALKQHYPNFEVLVLDDNSTDGTSEILEKLSGIINNLHHLKGKKKPADWLGKPWACHQLSKQAKGDYLVFIDADVWLEEDALSKAVTALQEQDCIAVWPKQYTGTFWERMIIPLIYYALFTLLPAKYVERKPRWMPESLNNNFSGAFAAACGQFLSFRRESYAAINGHESVRKEIVEDVELAKKIKKAGHKLRMYHGVNTVNCRMYSSHRELWNGLRKNFFSGFNKNIPLFLFMAVLHLIVFVAPLILLIFAILIQNYLISILAVIPLLLTFLQRLLLDIRFGWNPTVSLLHPVSVLWFQVLGIVCLYDYITGNNPSWKGRKV